MRMTERKLVQRIDRASGDLHHAQTILHRAASLAQLRMQRYFQMRLLTALGLSLIDGQNIIVDVLPSKFDHVAQGGAAIHERA